MPLLLFAFFLSCCLGCTKNGNSGGGTNPPVNPAQPARSWLALGDSYTIGQSVAVAERFPARTANLLRQQGINITDPQYIAQTGWTTLQLQAAINTQNPGSNYDMVSLLIGVNDQYQTRDTTGYAQRFEQLLLRAIGLAGGRKGRIFVLSIPDYSVTPFVSAADKPRVRQEIDAFNAINRRVTDAYGVSYTDITPSTREGANNAALIASDGLHPSGLEYKKWAELLAPKMKAVLQ